MMMMRKHCKHLNGQLTEVNYGYNFKQYHNGKLNNNGINEIDFTPSHYEFTCYQCHKTFTDKGKYPKWLDKILDQQNDIN